MLHFFNAHDLLLINVFGFVPLSDLVVNSENHIGPTI